jgi:hypothetical protein
MVEMSWPSVLSECLLWVPSMSTDTASLAQLFYMLGATLDQLPEQYPSLPQKTQLQEWKRDRNVCYKSTQMLLPILLSCLLGHSHSPTKIMFVQFCMVSVSLTSKNNFWVNNRPLYGLNWSGEHAGSHLLWNTSNHTHRQLKLKTIQFINLIKIFPPLFSFFTAVSWIMQKSKYNWNTFMVQYWNRHKNHKRTSTSFDHTQSLKPAAKFSVFIPRI